MKHNPIPGSLVLALAAVLAAGCVSHPPPLRGDFSPLTPGQASAGQHTGTPVRWGGELIETGPLADRTCFTVLSAPLDAWGHPLRRHADSGRFVACRAGFYDPALFRPGREVTFTGRINGHQQQRIGEYDYRIPQVAADVVYLWPERNDVHVIAPTPFLHPGWWW